MTHYNNGIKTILFINLFFITINLFAWQPENTAKYKVVIDAGHGGVDPGALGLKSYEKDIVLSIALKVGQLISSNCKNVETIFTRSDDHFVPLMDRAEIANKNKADLFISIHANSTTNTSIFGVETYAMGLQTSEKNFEVAKKENAVITLEKDYSTRYEGFDPNSAESYITFSLMQNTYLDQSLNFASFVQEQFVKFAHRTDKGVKQAGFLVLWKTSMPAVLIEIGFISNPEEEKFLTSEEGQNKIAQSIYKAFSNYRKSIESSVIISSLSKFSDSAQTNDNHKKENKNIKGNKSNINNKIPYNINPIVLNNTDSIVYRVQLTSSGKPINLSNAFFKHCTKICDSCKISEIKVADNYKYTIGYCLKYNEINEFNKDVKNYYPNAFIVALKNGTFIAVSEARKITGE